MTHERFGRDFGTQLQKSGQILVAELMDKRTSHSRTFTTDKEDVFVTEIVAGDPKYYRDDAGKWWVAEYGTTTKEAFGYQTQGTHNLLNKVVSLLSPQPVYAQSTLTFYPDPNPETSSVDGWAFLDNSTSWSNTRGAANGDAANQNVQPITFSMSSAPAMARIITASASRFFFLIPPPFPQTAWSRAPRSTSISSTSSRVARRSACTSSARRRCRPQLSARQTMVRSAARPSV